MKVDESQENVDKSPSIHLMVPLLFGLRILIVAQAPFLAIQQYELRETQLSSKVPKNPSHHGKKRLEYSA